MGPAASIATNGMANTAELTTDVIPLQTDILLNTLPVGAMVLDNDLVIVEWNEMLVQWTGLESATVVGTPLFEHFPNVLEPRYFGRLQQAIEVGTPATYSAALHRHFLPVPARHGLTDQQMVQQTEVRRISKSPRRVLVVISDVTLPYRQFEQLKRERAELVATKKQLEINEAKARGLVDQSCNLIALMSTDGCLVEVNQKALALMQVQAEEVQGEFPWNTRWWSHSPEQCERLKLAIARAAKGESDRFESNHSAADGSVVHVDYSFKPIRSDENEIIYLVAEGRDITEQKIASLQLDRGREEMQVILDHLPAFVWFKDTQNNVIRVNKSVADSLGLTPEEFHGRPASDFYPNEAEKFFNDDQKIIQSGEPLLGIEQPLTIGPTTRWHRTDKIPIFGEAGQVERILVVATDITAEKQQQKELRTRNEELQQVLYVVSHDLKSPLVTIEGFASLFRQHLEREDYEKAGGAAERIQRGVKTMGSLIDDILELSRVGRHELQPQSLEPHNTIVEAIDSLEALINKTGAKVQIADNLPTIVADKRLLFQVLLNLIQNSLKYGCPEAGMTIEIGGETTTAENRLYVRDFGPGIPAQFREKVFKLFQRLSSEKEGTGLGLATVAKALDRHQGKVWVGDSPGGGATFWMAFPNAPSHANG